MRALSVGHRFAISRLVLVPAIAVLLATPFANAQAQFGKLKKIGADAIKDKAKEKIAGKETPEASKPGTATEGSKSAAADSKPVNMTLNASQLDLMLAALTPMASDAEKATQVRRLASAHTLRINAAKKCMENGQAALMAGRTSPNLTVAAKARARQLEKDADRLSAVVATSYSDGNPRAGAFAQDSMGTMQMQGAVLGMGLACTFDFTPPAVMESQVATYGMSGDLPESQSSVPAEARTTFTKYQFALLRERIALFALSSADATVKVGKEGVFTDEEREALTARAAEIQKLQPYFKNGTLRWKGSGDLSKW
ncbi:hypothetical protein [Gemmatimonas sp.]|uniref:hypothetical protein n=1 Tax=Gemmatimonas sp. TaxID=1962908 RepID=UPI0039831CAC